MISIDSNTNYMPGGVGNDFSFNHDCNASNGVLVVTFFCGDQYPTGVTFNGKSLTQYSSATNTATYGNLYTYYIVNPDTGTHAVHITLSGSQPFIASAISFNNVDQTTPLEAGSVQGINTAVSSATTTLTTASPDTYVFSIIHAQDSNGTITPSITVSGYSNLYYVTEASPKVASKFLVCYKEITPSQSVTTTASFDRTCVGNMVTYALNEYIITKSFSDTVALADSTAKGTSLINNDTISLLELFGTANLYLKSFVDTFSLSEVIVKVQQIFTQFTDVNKSSSSFTSLNKSQTNWNNSQKS